MTAAPSVRAKTIVLLLIDGWSAIAPENGRLGLGHPAEARGLSIDLRSDQVAHRGRHL